MAETLAVIDASPLIFLSQAGFIDFLSLDHAQVVVPIPVAAEIRRRGTKDPAVEVLETTPWLQIGEEPEIPTVVLDRDLGPGESSVLATCLANPGATAILDDLAARRLAVYLEIPVRGTLGLVLIAKQRGQISAARPILEALRDSGMYLSDRVLNRALLRVDE